MINNVILTTGQPSDYLQYNKVAQDANNYQDVIHPRYRSTRHAPFYNVNIRFSGTKNPAFAERKYSDHIAPSDDTVDGYMYWLSNYPFNLYYKLDSIPFDVSSFQGLAGNIRQIRLKCKLTTSGTHPLDKYDCVLYREHINLADDETSPLHLHNLGAVPTGEVYEILDDLTADLISYPTTDIIVYSVVVVPAEQIVGGSGLYRDFFLNYFQARTVV
jgi:hypothetical protein